jgi:hypothetical protein
MNYYNYFQVFVTRHYCSIQVSAAHYDTWGRPISLGKLLNGVHPEIKHE